MTEKNKKNKKLECLSTIKAIQNQFVDVTNYFNMLIYERELTY